MPGLHERLLVGDELEDVPDPHPLIAGVLDLDSTALLYGASGTGKSFVALDWGLHVALGFDWHGHPVTTGQVLYVVGEGLSGTRSRYQAWKAFHDVDEIEAGITFAPGAPNILERAGKEELCEVVKKVDPILTILDTVARHIPGGDENSFQTMSQVVETLDWIRVQTHGCALGVHHAGKDESAGARGHSSLKAAMDTEILCTPGPRLTLTKQKNHEDGHLLGSFQLLAARESMVLSPQNKRTNRNDDLAIRALSSLGGEAAYNLWRDTCVALGMARGSFPRTCARLLEEAILVCDTSDTSEAQNRYRLA